MPQIKRLLTFGSVVFLSSCISVPLKPPQTGISTAKQFVEVPANILGPADAKKAKIFFITNVNAKVFGLAYRGTIRVADNQTVVGELQSASYLCWEREPGIATIKFTMVGQENNNGWMVKNFNTYAISTEAGQSYYLYFGGFAQRRILMAQDAMPLLSAYPPPMLAGTTASDAAPAPASALSGSQTKLDAVQRPV